MVHRTPDTQLEADQSFNDSLLKFQGQAADHGTTAALLASAHEHGFCWFQRPANAGLSIQVVLRHVGGSAFDAIGHNPAQLLLGLLGGGFGDPFPTAFDCRQPAEPEQEGITLDEVQSLADAIAEAQPSPAPTPSPAQPAQPAQLAAESLASATGGAVVADVVTDAKPDPATPLSDEQKAACVNMIKVLTAEQRKSFTIAFRDAFRVPREKTAVAPLITQVRHMEFCDTWSIEAHGGVAA